MTAETLPVPVAARHRAPAAAGTHAALGTRLTVSFAGILLLVAAVTALAAVRLDGMEAMAALACGGTALAAIAGVGAWLQRTVVGPLAMASEAAARISAGDLTGALEPDRGGELRLLLNALQDMRERLFEVVSQVRSGTTQVALNATQIARDNDALSHRTDMQAQALQETAASMEELTAAVRQNADTAQQASALVRAASGRAEQGGELMREVVETMGSIRTSSASIRDIIGVIDGIAFQTNILALNAAVEAARAGEQGRGFAVVASEVRTLAQRCAQAAREVKDLIGASVQKVDAGGRRVDEAGAAMGEIVAAVRQVADLIVQIDAASQEQSSGIDAINAAVNNIDCTTQQNAALVKDATRTAAAVQGRAVALMDAVAVFHLGVREHGTAAEAMALVQKGCEFHQQHGRDALVAEVNRLGEGRFLDRDLYLMVIGAHDAVFLAHGNNPRTLGAGPKSKDVDGKLFVQDMARMARERGEGWVDYKWAHPVTDRVLIKATYLRRVGDVVVACGIYKN